MVSFVMAARTDVRRRRVRFETASRRGRGEGKWFGIEKRRCYGSALVDTKRIYISTPMTEALSTLPRPPSPPGSLAPGDLLVNASNGSLPDPV